MQFSVKQLGLALGLAVVATGAPALAAASAPAAQHETRAAQSAPAKTAEQKSDEAAYAAREAKNPELAKYEGGQAIVIGSTVIAAILIAVGLALLL